MTERPRGSARSTKSASQARRRQRATALLPLAVLSGSWTVSLAGSGSASGSSGHLPRDLAVPAEAIDLPASVSTRGWIAPAVRSGRSGGVVSAASTHAIPTAALSAYQRAAQAINAADAHCNLDWSLLAAVGRVESDHGRHGRSVLTTLGVSRPGIYGIRLDGTGGTRKIADTDAGLYDKDSVYDRAVGPLQFIPTTWSVVAVDADGDGRRNPQDIDDAALAGAVYLCSGREDLSTDSGQSAAIFRYNHSREYVRLVKAIARAYAVGDYATTPTNIYASVRLSSAYSGADGPSFGGSSSTKHVGAPMGSTTAGQPAVPQDDGPSTPPEDQPDKPRNPAVSVLTQTVTAVGGALVPLLAPTPVGGLVRGLLGEEKDQ